MPISFKNSLIWTPRVTGKPPIPVWLPIAHDPRPTCCLLFGDGFTQSLLNAAGLSDRVHCTMDDLIPARPYAQYIPTKEDRFSPGPLWDEAKWPRIWKAYNESGVGGREFFIGLALANLNPTRDRGFWSFRTGTIEYELRCYLWHLFRYYQSEFRLNPDGLAKWPWRRLLHYCLAEFRLATISFNYDMWLEVLLSNGLFLGDDYYSVPLLPIVEARALDPYAYRAGTVLTIKPHGCIWHHLDLNGIPSLGANPWLSENDFSHNSIGGVQTRFEARESFPMVPDLVPPGRQGDDYCNPASLASALARDTLHRAAIVIACGLSGAEPDTAEIESLVQAVDPSAHIVHVGLGDRGDEENVVANAARAQVGSNYSFVDASDVGEVAGLLQSMHRSKWHWS